MVIEMIVCGVVVFISYFYYVFMFGKQMVLVLENISLQLCLGESVVLLGFFGCGKLILLWLLVGLEVLQSGQMQIDGVVFGVLGLE